MEPVFPNSKFIETLIIMIAISWTIGILVKKYIKKSANGNKKIETNLKTLFLYGTVSASVFILGLFMLV